MNRRLLALTARRAALQAQCGLQRDDLREALGSIQAGTARVDRIVEAGRRMGPIVIVVGIFVALMVGPRRVLAVACSAVTLGICTENAYRLAR